MYLLGLHGNLAKERGTRTSSGPSRRRRVTLPLIHAVWHRMTSNSIAWNKLTWPTLGLARRDDLQLILTWAALGRRASEPGAPGTRGEAPFSGRIRACVLWHPSQACTWRRKKECSLVMLYQCWTVGKEVSSSDMDSSVRLPISHRVWHVSAKFGFSRDVRRDQYVVPFLSEFAGVYFSATGPF